MTGGNPVFPTEICRRWDNGAVSADTEAKLMMTVVLNNMRNCQCLFSLIISIIFLTASLCPSKTSSLVKIVIGMSGCTPETS